VAFVEYRDFVDISELDCFFPSELLGKEAVGGNKMEEWHKGRKQLDKV
jgi:hypothetical protein